MNAVSDYVEKAAAGEHAAATIERQRARIAALEAGLDRAIREIVAMRDTFHDGVIVQATGEPDSPESAEELADWDRLIDELRRVLYGARPPVTPAQEPGPAPAQAGPAPAQAGPAPAQAGATTKDTKHDQSSSIRPRRTGPRRTVRQGQ